MGGGEVIIEVPLVALSVRMSCWDLGEIRSHPLVYFPASCCAAMTGWSASAVCNLVATSVKTPVRPMWYCGAVLFGVSRLVSYHRRNQTSTCLSVQRDSGAAMTRSDLTVTAWKKSKMLSQSSVMVANVSVVDLFFFPIFFFMSSYAS